MKNKNYFPVILLTSVLISIKAMAQTDPAPFDLSTGNYSLTSWDSLAPAGTYPSNMIFHFINNPSVAGFDSSSVANADWDCPYNRHTRSRIIGLETDGFAFVVTSNGQYSDCISVTGADSAQRYVGTAVLGLNTTNRGNIQVSWVGGTVTPGDGNGNPAVRRKFTLMLQYRIGTSGNFTNVPGPVEYISDSVAGTMQAIGPVPLPSSCENQPNVQLRWIYFHVGTGSGTRPLMRLDDISVTSSVFLGIHEEEKKYFTTVYPNPSASAITIFTDYKGEKQVKMYDAVGMNVISVSADENKIAVDRKNLPDGFYLVEILDRNDVVISTSKLILN